MIIMKQDDCILCDGSGKVTPYPYRRQETCDHSWSRGSFMDRHNKAHSEMKEAIKEYEKWSKALETEIK